MSGVSKVYTNLVQAHNTVLQGPGPIGVAAGAIVTTNLVPVKGAKLILGRIIGTDGNAWANMNLWLSNQNSRIVTGAIFGPPAGYAARTAALLIANASTTGIVTAVECPPAGAWHDFCQFWCTANAGSAHTGVTLSVEVYYNDDADRLMGELGQRGMVPLTT